MIFFHPDGLGSILALTNAQGNLLARYTYDAFGSLRSTTNDVYNSVLFAGEWQDPTGLIYLRARYYDPATGRFLSRDPYPGALDDPSSLNLYAYCGNNPVLYIDPTGEIKVCQLDDLLKGVLSSLGDSVRDVFKSPGAVYELIKAMQRGQLTFNDFKNALGASLVEPFTYVYQHSYGIWKGNPSDREVFLYGKQLGEGLQTVIGAVAGGGAAIKLTSKLAKVAPKAAEAIEKAAVKTAEAAEIEYVNLVLSCNNNRYIV